MSRTGGFDSFDTGEVDSETGEVLTPLVHVAPKCTVYGDSETGEQAQKRLVYQRSKFRVPRSALTLPVFDTAVLDSAKKKDTDSGWDLTLLALPLLVLLPGWAIVLYLLVETVYHSWAHSYSSSRKPARTPLHLLFKAKCAECLSHKQMRKVGQLQDEWNKKVNSRRILSYNYCQFSCS